MLGPVFNREALVLPKRPATYLARGLYVGTLFLLLCTGYLVLDGSRSLIADGDAARFGVWVFRLLSPLQLVVLTALAAVGAASSVAQEKDRRTLLLLLMTRLSGFEVVAGKAAATLLSPLSLLMCALPLFLCLPLLGGVSPAQVLAVFAVTAISVVISAAIGTVIALWREKTFQAIALTVLVLLSLVGLVEILAATQWVPATILTGLSPWRAVAAAAGMTGGGAAWLTSGVAVFLVIGGTTAAGLIAWGIARVRVWNPSREVRLRAPEPETSEDAETSETPASWKVRKPRRVWDNPVMWREIRTWAYGRKIILIRLAFALVFATIAAVVWYQMQTGIAFEAAGRIGRALPASTIPVAVLGVVSLVLINALAVNSITGERDGLALDLLLVTDLSPKEFVFGKLWGVMYAAKEMIALPIALVLFMGVSRVLTLESMVFAVIGFLVLVVFAIVLGIHSGLNYVAGRTATLASLGTIFFLCVGIATCMTIMVSFRGAFQLQLAPFLVMVLGGGAALFAALGWRNPSSAIFAAAFALPLFTFYTITQFLLQTDHLFVLFALSMGYGFTTAAMMVPALSEFDVSLEPDRAPAESST
ncbi:MAG: hypothetical protein AAGD07_18705 [Planctomycetota bacterium]